VFQLVEAVRLYVETDSAIVFHREDLPTLLAEEQRKFEGTRTAQGWCWRDESYEQSYYMLGVASAFGSMCDSYYAADF
jgi:hypothetical protein